MNNTITILSLVKITEEEQIKEVYKSITSKYSDSELSEILKIGRPRQVPNQLLFALEIEKSDAVKIIKELTYAGVAIVKNDPSISAAINEAKFELENQQATTIQRIKRENELKVKLNKKGSYSIEELEYLRDWQLMVEVGLKQSFNDLEKARKIKEMLPEVLNEAINKEIEFGSRSLGAAKSSIEKLSAIAENETLKRFHFTGSMKKAGEAIINLCSEYPKDFLGDLVFLANSSSTISYINIKSFLTFYKFVSENQELYDYEILVATRHLNTRALDTIHQASVKLTNDEKALFDNGIQFFKERRKNLTAK
ncbi:MAG: hypothetical protein KJ571_11965 [Bacteroidetes bacterium]|nr:hypothetical protein [Bacteroidota bacterium]